MVDDVVGDAQSAGDRTRVADILPGAAGALALHRRAMVVKLQRDTDGFRPAGCRQRRHHRRVDSARHGDNDSPRAAGGQLKKCLCRGWA